MLIKLIIVFINQIKIELHKSIFAEKT